MTVDQERFLTESESVAELQSQALEIAQQSQVELQGKKAARARRRRIRNAKTGVPGKNSTESTRAKSPPTKSLPTRQLAAQEIFPMTLFAQRAA